MNETRSRLDYEVRDGIAVITLNDPPANTYSYEMMQELDRAILDARMDEAVQVIVITGAGEKFFLRGRRHSNALERHAHIQVLLLSSCKRDPRATRTNAEARDRSD